MADKGRAQSALIVEIGFEGKDAEHQIEPARHLFNPPPVPRPDLRTDAVDNLLRGRIFSLSACEPQSESPVIDQAVSVRFACFDLAKRRMKLFSKITVLLDHF